MDNWKIVMWGYLLLAVIVSLAIMAGRANAETRIGFDCPFYTSPWGSVQTLVDGAFVYDNFHATFVNDGCGIVDNTDPRAEWDIHQDASGTLHTFSWPHPDVPTDENGAPLDPTLPFKVQANSHAHQWLNVEPSTLYRLGFVVRTTWDKDGPDEWEHIARTNEELLTWAEHTALGLRNNLHVSVQCPGQDWLTFYTWAPEKDRWPPRWTTGEGGRCRVNAQQLCHQDGIEGGIAANPRGECHNDLLPYRVRKVGGAQSCGVGPELALVVPLLWWARRRA